MAGINQPSGDVPEQEAVPTANETANMPTAEQGATDVQEWIVIAEKQMDLAINTRQKVQAMLASTLPTNPPADTMTSMPAPTELHPSAQAKNDLPLAA